MEGTLLAVGTAGATVALIGEGSHGGIFAVFQAFFSSLTLVRTIAPTGKMIIGSNR